MCSLHLGLFLSVAAPAILTPCSCNLALLAALLHRRRVDRDMNFG